MNEELKESKREQPYPISLRRPVGRNRLTNTCRLLLILR
jgi:hypothetical protein